MKQKVNQIAKPQTKYIGILDQYQYLGNCLPTPPLTNIYLNLLSIDCCWVKGGVGGQLPR